MNPYLNLVSEYARLARDGKQYPLGGFSPAARPALSAGAPNVLIFSPHPDDECIIGGLPLRLLREAGMRVINVAVTQGSRKDRQAERFAELTNACEFIGYGLVQTGPAGLEKVNPQGRAEDPGNWARSVEIIRGILEEHRPHSIFFPHEQDWNSSHIGTHLLVTDALHALVDGFACFTIETEYWGPMAAPNLMVESTVQDVADLVTGTSFHVGEVRRNPFHLLLPAWMQDNVRRGSELVGGQGEAAPDYGFATLYRLRRWAGGGWQDVLKRGRQLPSGENPSLLFGSQG
jgi:LmbE family N-acetylglucosaminyl deacetylase